MVEKVSFLVATDEDFHGLELEALREDLKVAGSVGLKYRSAWERLAVVTDKDWMRHGVAAFGWVIPGEVRVFEPGALQEAKAWTGGAGPSSRCRTGRFMRGSCQRPPRCGRPDRRRSRCARPSPG